MKTKIAAVLGIVSLLGLFAFTTPAEAITCDSVTLTGNVTTFGNPTNARFAYGTSQSAVSSGNGSHTPVQTFFSDGNIFETITGLSGNTTYFYRLEVTNNFGTDFGSIRSFTTPSCNQNTNPVNINFFRASPEDITSGQSSNLSWSVDNATSCNASGGWSGNKSTTSGTHSQNVSPNSTTSYILTCINSNSSDSETIQVRVSQPQPQKCTDPNATNYLGNLPCQYPTPPQKCLDPNALNYLGNLPCQYPQNPQRCLDPNATNYLGNLPCQYPQPPQRCLDPNALNYLGNLPCQYPQNPQRCLDPNANNYLGNLPCKYSQPNNRPSVTITADDTSIDEDDSTTIRWNSNDADSCEGDGGDNGWDGRNLADSGSFNTGRLDRDTTFRIICEDNDGDTDSDSVTIRVDDDNDNNNDDLNVRIEADDTRIDEGDSTRIRWNSDDADFCEGDSGANGWNGRRLNEDGTFNTGSLFRDTTFRITCEDDDNDTDSDSVTIRVSDDDSGNDGSAPTAVTTLPTQLSNSTAQLSGLIFPAGDDTDAWFEWGPSVNMGNRTNVISVGSSSGSIRHVDTISGLSTGVTYYFRAVAENSFDRSFGNIMTFPMQNLTRTVIVPPTTTTVINRVVSGGTAESLVKLTIDEEAEVIFPGERKTYHISWESNTSQTLEDVILRVILPGGMNFEGSDQGSFSLDDNTLTLDLNTLSPRESGDIFVAASAKNNLEGGEMLVIVASMVYTDESDTQGEALAYQTHRVIAGSALGANIFGAGFLPDTFFEWLLFLILVLIIVFLSKHLYGQFKAPAYPTVPVPPPHY